MYYAFLIHKVKDYTVWRPFYDADEGRRNKYGIRTLKVFRAMGEPNKVCIYWKVHDPAKVDEMGKEPDLREVIKKAGVIDQPEIYFYEEA